MCGLYFYFTCNKMREYMCSLIFLVKWREKTFGKRFQNSLKAFRGEGQLEDLKRDLESCHSRF